MLWCRSPRRWPAKQVVVTDGRVGLTNGVIRGMWVLVVHFCLSSTAGKGGYYMAGFVWSSGFPGLLGH